MLQIMATGQPSRVINNQCTTVANTAGNPTARDHVVHANLGCPASKVWLIHNTHARTLRCTQLPRTKGRACSINNAKSRDKKLMG